MKRKNVIIISITGITLILLCLLGFTYGYFLTVINGNTNEKSVDVTTAIKGLEIQDLSEEDVNVVIEPGYENIKLFTIKNTGNTKTSYNIYLTDVVNTFERTLDVEYTLYRKDGNATINVNDLSDCTIISTGSFPTLNSYIATNEIINNNNDYYTYALKVVYKNLTDVNQNIDQGKTFSYKVIIDEEKTSLLKNTILESAKKGGTNRTTLGTTVTEFTSISGENERVLNNAPDDYGTSYYFRGNVLDNYVSFADKLWRIVRINGDGTIRLVLDDVAKDTSGNVITTAFNSKYDDNAYIGYMYGTPGSTTYDDTHKNINDSTIKTQVDEWYKINIVDTNNSSYVADTLFCNDKTLASSTIGKDNTALGYGTNKTYYSSTERLQYSTGTTNITTSKPTFKCAENVTNDYSRFTVNVHTLSNGNKTNGNLTYPVGLLTADEVAYGGAYRFGVVNTSYYLYNSSTNFDWWTFTSYYFNGGYAGMPYFNKTYIATNYVDVSYKLRPSINLKSEILINTGDGTKENPYVVFK